MLDFTFQNPAKILFGKDQVPKVGKEVKKFSERILLVYGGGSIKRSGLYDEVTQILKENGVHYEELPGVQANPRITSVREGIRLCRENNLDLVLAVGGGSTIDCAKAIACGFYHDGDPWDFFIRKARVTNALPIGVILTLAATGSEMNGNTVINNDDTMDKKGIGSPRLVPKFSILDPTYTFTVPANQTAAGVVDIISHIFETYFSANNDAYLQDRMCEAVIKTCIHYGPIALKEPENYEARANLMWASTVALNGLLSTGKRTDWATHMIEHEVSAIYDMTHGLGLAILTPYWMEYVLDDSTVEKLADYARNVWGVSGQDNYEVAREGIRNTQEFFKSLGLSTTLKEEGVKEESLETMAKKATEYGPLGNFKKLETSDVLEILKKAYA
ncbi:NADH-dependent butanol dehydrogenase A [Candidatus Syntrophocurvum alkaliphilum]|uniref:NADH-dependent butanol dehydrogenase A n=1 Tax=Candidatus Syntrophocurvum alkaliphilum TaxID=2293317 RepID=A0A6I6DJB6_9FIRM|nr:iron-containing alcohol dehydrogenase [Candidatus Syntrophocurvum alkaliphilum]QGU00241.1 NADH-dependent butanol dehydrogenase A [Candidatus Syntrophocurvum alkaliphilum]